MNNNNETELDHIMDQIENSINLCLEHCNAKITEKTKDPFSIVMNEYDLYRSMTKVEELYYSNVEGYEDAPFTPLKFNQFYRMLNRSVKDILKCKQPEESIYEL